MLISSSSNSGYISREKYNKLKDLNSKLKVFTILYYIIDYIKRVYLRHKRER